MNQEELFYEMIFKRKSFHIFRDTQTITPLEIKELEAAYQTFTPLIKDIKTDIQIVPAEKTTCKRGEEFCILLYSEKKENYLQNIGYIGEQLDLYLASLNIGTLWFGIGKIENIRYKELDFVIMLAIAKVSGDKFRKDMFKSKRKPIEELWQGDFYREIGNIARFSPSACNTQPWKVDAKEHELMVYRYKKPGKRGMMPVDKVAYYNRIDIGIFLCFLELCFHHNHMDFERELFVDNADDVSEEVLVAKYSILEDKGD